MYLPNEKHFFIASCTFMVCREEKGRMKISEYTRKYFKNGFFDNETKKKFVFKASQGEFLL